MRTDYARQNLKDVILLVLYERKGKANLAELNGYISQNLSDELKELTESEHIAETQLTETNAEYQLTESGYAKVILLKAENNPTMIEITSPAVILWHYLNLSHQYNDALESLAGAELNTNNAGRIIAEQQNAIDTQAETITRQALEIRTLKRQAGELERDNQKIVSMLEGIAEIAHTAPNISSTNAQKEGMLKLIAQSLYNVLNFAKRQEIPF